jgi:hypothetical protein
MRGTADKAVPRMASRHLSFSRQATINFIQRAHDEVAGPSLKSSLLDLRAGADKLRRMGTSTVRSRRNHHGR